MVENGCCRNIVRIWRSKHRWQQNATMREYVQNAKCLHYAENREEGEQLQLESSSICFFQNEDGSIKNKKSTLANHAWISCKTSTLVLCDSHSTFLIFSSVQLVRVFNYLSAAIFVFSGFGWGGLVFRLVPPWLGYPVLRKMIKLIQIMPLLRFGCVSQFQNIRSISCKFVCQWTDVFPEISSEQTTTKNDRNHCFLKIQWIGIFVATISL